VISEISKVSQISLLPTDGRPLPTLTLFPREGRDEEVFLKNGKKGDRLPGGRGDDHAYLGKIPTDGCQDLFKKGEIS
jgi:hypothetical protein